MAMPSKPAELLGRGYSKEEIENRKLAEQTLQGNSDKVNIPPRWLCKDGKKEYKKLVKELENAKILTNVDIGVVATVADAYVKMAQANKIIQEEGLIITKLSDRGSESLIEHPATKIYKQYNSIYKQFLSEIGLSPASRAKLSIINVEKEKEKKNPVLQALKKRSDT